MLSLACGQAEQGPPGGASGTAGASTGGASSAGTGGVGGSTAGTGGSSAAGSDDGGTGTLSGGSAGKGGASSGGSAGTGTGGKAGTGGSADAGDGGTPSAGSGGAAGTSAGTGGSSGGGGAPAGFPPFTAFMPAGDPITLDGIVNASDIAWKASTDTFFLLTDRTTTFHEYSADFATTVRTITLVNSPVDAEGLAYLGEVGGLDRFALGVEANEVEVLIFDLDPEATTLDFATAVVQTYVPGPAPSVANKGWEGVAYRPAASGQPAWLWACLEGEPGQVPIRVVGFPYLPSGAASLSYADDSLTVEEPWNAAEKLGADDLSSLVYDADSDTLLVLSDLSSRLMRVDPATGDVLDTLMLSRSPQYEGVTLASGGRLVVVSEPNFVEIFELPGA